MRDIEIIKDNPRIHIVESDPEGFRGFIGMPAWEGTIVCSWGAGWEHVSIAPAKSRITPSWDDMCRLKEMFFEDDEAVIQIHPPKAEYVNNKPNCLHLWRCKYREMILPPSCLVGIKKGQTMAELDKEIKAAYEMAGEKYDG